MKLDVDGLIVLFPYDYIYPEQYHYMLYLKQTLDSGGNSVIEMPSGTGKTVSLLSLIYAYLVYYPSKYSKLVYCTRTVPEIEKVLKEVAKLHNFYETSIEGSPNFLCMGLSSRKNLCINEEVCFGDVRDVDRQCHGLTSTTARQKFQLYGGKQCEYFENLESKKSGYALTNSVFALEDLMKYGKENCICPYFLARRSVLNSKILVYSYAYLVDPKVSEIVSKEIEASSIIVFDEAHNIDSACIEAFSISLTQNIILTARTALDTVKTALKKIKDNNEERLQNEYSLMLKGLNNSASAKTPTFILPNPILSRDILNEAVPGNIRKADHFVAFLQRFVEYLASRMHVRKLLIETPMAFLRKLNQEVGIDSRSLRFSSDRLRVLLTSLELDASAEISAPLGVICCLGTLVSTYDKGFTVILEPFEASAPDVFRPKIYLSCTDASLAMKPIFEKFKTVIITSGTLSPLDMYPRLLNFHPCVVASLSISLARRSICPMIVTKGSDQGILSSSFADRFEPAVIRNYGTLVADICAVVPDGVVVFFTSYRHMEAAINAWSEMDLLSRIQKHKLAFVETPNVTETSLALDGFKRACECGRGGLLFSIARGKVSEGIDFYDHLGRAVIVLGVPYVYTLSSILRARLDYLRDNFGIKEADFLTFDAMRHTAQCIGRVMRSKTDYGIMILADQRFAKPSRIKKLPKWIQDNLHSSNIGLSSDDAVQLSKRFLREMAQPLSKTSQLGVSLLDEKHLASETFTKNLKVMHEVAIEIVK